MSSVTYCSPPLAVSKSTTYVIAYPRTRSAPSRAGRGRRTGAAARARWRGAGSCLEEEPRRDADHADDEQRGVVPQEARLRGAHRRRADAGEGGRAADEQPPD